MNLISERIQLSDFKTIEQTDYYQFLHRYNPTQIILNKINLRSNVFLRNKFNTNYIYTHYVIPLYNRFSFSTIKIKYNLISINDNVNVYHSSNEDDVIKYLDLNIKKESHSNFRIEVTYTYDTKSRQYLENKYHDIPWAKTFNGVRRCLRFLDSPRSMLKEYFRWCGLLNSTIFENLLKYSIQIVLPFFDKLKQLLHQNINYLPPECRYFFDIPTIAGYPKMDNRLFNDDPYKWLTEESSTIYTRQWWCDAFTKTYGQAVIRSPTHLLTLHEFAHNRWLWVTDGATRFSKLEIDGEKVSTKFGAAVTLTDDEIDKLLELAVSKPHSKASEIGIFIKPDEKGYKRRLIANVPLGGYIICSYIRYLITSFTGEEPLFMKLSPSVDEVIDVIHFLKNKQLALPLDESAYDYNVTRPSWLGFFDFLNNTFNNNSGVKAFKKYFDIAIWNFDGNTNKWLAGMPSGLALTSFLNSWMNYIKQGTITPGYINWAAGDDVLTFPYQNEVDMQDISDQYAKFGAVANPIKNWKSNRYAEYLKRFYSATGTSGYPARIWSSLMWAGTERFFLPSDRLPEIAELFKQFFDRIGLPMDERYVAKDLARSISNKVDKFNMYTALDWLHSPRVHGGFGCLPYNNKTFTWQVENTRVKKVNYTLIRIPRYLEYYGKINLIIGKYTLTTKNYRCGKSFKLARLLTMDDWEKRLNREDIDYHGPFQGLIMDVIPLPTVNFVSTSMMSAFASQHFFNSYPNLHGTWNTIASRLVNASLALVDLLNTKLTERDIITFI